MIEGLIILAITFGAGWWTGHENPTISCRDEPLITANCIEVPPPVDNSFGATTYTMRLLHDQYKECRQAIATKHEASK